MMIPAFFSPGVNIFKNDQKQKKMWQQNVDEGQSGTFCNIL